MHIFLAGSYSRQAELRGLANELTELKHVVTSSWLEGHADDPLDQSSFQDVQDIQRSNCIMLQLEDPSAGYLTGGRWVELGLAMAYGLRLIVFGHAERENVHCHFPGMVLPAPMKDNMAHFYTRMQPVEHYETWEEAKAALREDRQHA